MKLADRVVETHSAGIKSTSGFSIAQTSKMFKILSDSLYSDKVMAVIRELSTNAYDSHINAGNRNPFKVILPNATNPSFTVRDYGTGLSRTDMENLYTTYGASDKNDSNDFVGCLGLGSKSPFAYTKSFTTSSYYNGMKYTYIAAIDDNGVPTLNLFDTSKTDEPNGLEINFAVKQYDFYEFSNKAIRIFHYFKNKPIVEGGVIPSLKDHTYSNKNIILSGEGWRVCLLASDSSYFPNNHHKIDSGVIALMGNIAYPVNVAQIIGEQKQDQPEHIAKWNRAFGKADIDSWKSFVTEILNQNLYLELDFNIGELEMEISREGLQYTKSVIKTLREKTQGIYLEMKDEFSKKLTSAKTKVEAISTYYQMNDLAGGWGVGASWTDSEGKKHEINSGQDLEYTFEAGKNLYVFNYRRAGYRSRRLVYMTNRIHHNTLTGKGEYYWNKTRKNGVPRFFVCDIKTEETAKKILTRYCNDNDCFAYLMVDSKDISKSNEGFDDLIKDVGSENILKVSDYKDLIKNNNPRKTVTRNSRGSVSDQDIFFVHGASKDSGPLNVKYNDAIYLKTLTADELEDFEDSDEIVYVPITRYETTSGTDTPAISSLHRLFNEETTKDLFKEMFGDTKIYAIKSNMIDKLKKDYSLIPFNTFFKDKLSIAAKKFSSIVCYRDVVEWCKAQYEISDNKPAYYNTKDTVDEFCCHMLNIFGLDYKKFIKNPDIIKVIDSYLIIEYFAVTIHQGSYDIQAFNQTDYDKHINSLLNDIGITNVDSKSVRSINSVYNLLVHYISRIMYKENEGKEYMDILNPSNKTKINILKKSDLRTMVKTAIDKNPMVKYIIGTTKGVDGNLRSIGNDNPIANLRDMAYQYSDTNRKWMKELNKDGVNLLRVQLGSIIN